MQYKLKKQYEKYRLILCNPNKIEVALLTPKNSGIHGLRKSMAENELTSISFTIPITNGKISDNSAEMLLLFEGEYYIIKTIDISSDEKTYSVSAIHEVDELRAVPCNPVEQIGVEPITMFNDIIAKSEIPLTNYIWGGTDITDMRRSLVNDKDVESQVSVYENLISMAEVFESSIEFKTNQYGRMTVYFRNKYIDNGKYIKRGNGLKQLNVNISSEEIFTRLRAFGGENAQGFKISLLDSALSGGKSYIEDYSYYVAKGMTIEQCKAKPQCCAIKIWEDDSITDPDTLYHRAVEELKKASQPMIDGTIEMYDVSVLEGYTLTSPRISEEIKWIDKDINYIITARVVGVTNSCK